MTLSLLLSFSLSTYQSLSTLPAFSDILELPHYRGMMHLTADFLHRTSLAWFHILRDWLHLYLEIGFTCGFLTEKVHLPEDTLLQVLWQLLFIQRWVLVVHQSLLSQVSMSQSRGENYLATVTTHFWKHKGEN